MTQRAFIKTYGCQMNSGDSERIRGILVAHGYEMVSDVKEADLAIFNTCSVREKAEQKVFSDIGRLRGQKERHPGFRIALCGCIPQVQREGILRKNPLIDIVFGVNNISGLMDFIAEAQQGKRTCRVEDEFFESEYDMPSQREDAMKAFVTIMNGCDNYCSYCIVPYTRGRERSRSAPSILAEIRQLVDDGVREVTLLGQNVNSYRWQDKAGALVDFPQLLHLVHDIPELQRIRFVTSHPKDFSEAMMEAMALPRVCKYLHLPIQAGSNRILKLMNRGYTREEYLAKIARLKERIPGVALSSDFLVGFPGETEEDFLQTMDILEQVEYKQIFGFNYSVRPETKAATMADQVPFEVMNERLNRLFAAQQSISHRLQQTYLGTTLGVLVEGASKNNPAMLTGRTDFNTIVHFAGGAELIGRLVDVHINETREFTLYGEVLAHAH
ncbi:tRNA (N6-isopentenyl adenosine(37)-C2)-methylthiotransferase MiaB [Desulfurispirillum indicum]|uniref:tRNA (N6-isopentenyl adenosine(37)-C2)-methylthiotransferase MiaB n=1 Tax=Desulfurispirillum indicum TaxID=936456 RepID=UPI001CFB630B|nr:tRNA (N6-isopentenyl adenosine(37)-C2)-methylthiotransferase MiaB [Desulfurispirillum indicum]UCZ57199.1 tRNA (N6-isopentenyl adenosine(37)-C2)-methylthiotransferase MiaB [Desulfurispirillum indicum]